MLCYRYGFCFSLQIHGLQDPGGLHWFGEYGKPNGQEPDQTRLPCDCYRCFPRVMQRATGTGCSSEIKHNLNCLDILMLSPLFNPDLRLLSLWSLQCCVQLLNFPLFVCVRADDLPRW